MIGRCLVATAVLLAVCAAPASARDPGRWLLTGYTSVPIYYWQGMTSQK